jgi:glycosyltransferase involved in cell wall biosynthesis
MKKIRKIWIWNHYATEMFANRGGRHYWFAKYLKQRGFEPVIFCANTFHNKDDCIDTGGRRFSTQELDGISFVFVRTRKASGNGLARIINMLLFYLTLCPAARAYARQQGRPDLILASSVHPLTLLAGVKLAKRWQIPCICEIRDLWPEAIFTYNRARENSLAGKLLVAGEHWIYRRADRLIFTKEGDTDYLLEKGWDKKHGGDIDMRNTYYINNGVDLAAFDEQIKSYPLADAELSSGRLIAVYTGAIRVLNDVGKLIDAARLLQAYPDICILVYGDGTELAALKRRAVEEGLDNIVFKGHVSKLHIPYILSRARVNLLTYSSTMFNWTRGNSSNKLFEYMASGRPIITNVRMNYSPLKQYQCGVELAGDTAQALADAIRELCHMPEQEYEALCRNARKAAGDFDFAVITDKLVRVIEGLEDEGALDAE